MPSAGNRAPVLLPPFQRQTEVMSSTITSRILRRGKQTGFTEQGGRVETEQAKTEVVRWWT